MVTKRPYGRIATFYDLLNLPFEYRRYRPLRRLLFEGTGGNILDAGLALVEDRCVVHDIVKLLVLRQPQKEDPTEKT